MDIFNVLTLIGGLCLFLFGMNVMGEALERRAGGKLKAVLGKLTQNKAAGFLTGLGVTSIIQSSSATTVMVVGFVNSGLITLRQAISVIMGANVGTTVTAWILSLGGIESDNLFTAYINNDVAAAAKVEPLEQVIDGLKEKMRTRHILRLQQGECSIVAGFVWSDLLNNLERTSDHCSNIAGCIIESLNNEMNSHESHRDIRSNDADYWDEYKNYLEKYSLKKT